MACRATVDEQRAKREADARYLGAIDHRVPGFPPSRESIVQRRGGDREATVRPHVGGNSLPRATLVDGCRRAAYGASQEGALDTIAEQTYAVLDLPTLVADKILEIRRRHRDDFRAALPAEVTLVGSGGVGCVAAGQPARRVFEVLDQIAAETPPIEVALGVVERFPNTDIFGFRFVDDSMLQELHERIAGSGLAFDPTPFAFGPHVTLRSRSPVSDEDAKSVLAERIDEPFRLADLSVYRLERDSTEQKPVTCRLLHRTRLGGTPD